MAAAWDDLLQGEELAYLTTEPPREPRIEPLPGNVHPALLAALARQGVERLYAHQAEAWTAARAGGNVIVTTGTASGKTLAFNLPVLDALATAPKNRALYLYPTKALAQDQARALGELAVPGVRAAIYDGDTPTGERRQIRKWANLILTNPDMLHLGVLPRHDLWADVLHNLRYVVIDEAHVYRGVFGSHVANVLRRLRRLARIYGAEPQFIFASATIANPGELAFSLLGDSATVIGDDAAPRAERTVALWNPELLDAELGLRASALGDAARLLRRARAARPADDLLREEPQGGRADPSHGVRPRRLDNGEAPRAVPCRLHAAAAPRHRAAPRRGRAARRRRHGRTRARHRHRLARLRDLRRLSRHDRSLRQQWGRAGRRGHGLAVLVASEDALDQYFMREPETLLGRRVEAAILDHANPRVLDGHVAAAAFEAPIDDADRETLGDEALERAPHIPELQHTTARLGLGGQGLPGRAHVLRSTSADAFTVIDATTASLLGLVERERAYSTVHEGAVYLHLGEQWLVRELDLARTHAHRRAVLGRLVHAGQEGDVDGHRGAAARRAATRPRAHVRPRLGDRAGRRVPAQERSATSPRSTPSSSTCPRPRSTRRPSGTSRPHGSSRASRRCRRCSRRSTPRSTR